MKSRKRNIFIKASALLTTVIMLFCILSVGVSADSGLWRITRYATYNRDIQKGCYCFWDDNASQFAWNLFAPARMHFSGWSWASWLGTNPWTADNITVSNIISLQSVGGSLSVSVGSGGASVGFSTSSSSNSVTYQYSVSDDWDLTVDFDYYARTTGFCLRAGFIFEVSAIIQLGSHFYSI